MIRRGTAIVVNGGNLIVPIKAAAQPVVARGQIGEGKVAVLIGVGRPDVFRQSRIRGSKLYSVPEMLVGDLVGIAIGGHECQDRRARCDLPVPVAEGEEGLSLEVAAARAQ